MMADNVNGLFADLLYRLRDCPIEESRNGMVRAVQEPIVFGVNNPHERVLFNPMRKSNPYFHVMETVWMFAGEDDAKWLEPFNRNIMSYAEANGRIHGAYGHRWRNRWHRDQIAGVVRQLKRDPNTRQAVIAMWDSIEDYHIHWKDRPCNTHIYFRQVNGRLDMTICNRSNDVVWGACGANIVHMSYLHELVATASRLPMGKYRVMCNNLHIYQHHWPMLDNPLSYNIYDAQDLFTMPVLEPERQDLQEFLNECEQFIKYTDEIEYKSRWLEHVAKPMYNHYQSRLNGDYHSYDIEETQDDAWALAEKYWREWHGGE